MKTPRGPGPPEPEHPRNTPGPDSGRRLKDLDIGRALKNMLDIAVQHQLSPPPDLIILVKALIQIEGLGRQLDPDFNILAKAPPLWYGMPVLGILGFLGAAVVGFWLLYDFLKNNRF